MISRVQGSGYQRYRSWLNSLNVSKFQAFNELNHFKVIKELREVKNFNAIFSNSQLIKLWQEMMGAEKVDHKRIVLNCGVRQGLSSIFELYKDSKWAIPSNIYPVYSALARSAAVSEVQEYNAFDTSRLTDRLTDTKVDVLLITDPTPFGQDLSSAEVNSLLQWVSSAEDTLNRRRVVVDCVYAAELRSELQPLIESDKAFVLHSLSKAHALPLHLGFTVTPCPEGVTGAAAHAAISRPQPDPQMLRDASFCLSTYPTMMREQREIFRAGWEELLPSASTNAGTAPDRDAAVFLPEQTAVCDARTSLSALTAGTVRPSRSYLSLSAAPFGTALEQGILPVPTSIYVADADTSTATPTATVTSPSPHSVVPPAPSSNSIFSLLGLLQPANLKRPLPFTKTMYHVTRASNFAKGFDKYSMSYSKSGVKQSTFPDRFYLLYLQELFVGVNKTTKSLQVDAEAKAKAENSATISPATAAFGAGDFPVVIQTRTVLDLLPSPSGVAQYVSANHVVVEKVGVLAGYRSGSGSGTEVHSTQGSCGSECLCDCDCDCEQEQNTFTTTSSSTASWQLNWPQLSPADAVDVSWMSVEEMYAHSMRLNDASLTPFSECVPRSISILPVAQGCQAKCPFCFSHSSISDDLNKRNLNMDRINHVLDAAKSAGAERAVITGGGEPLVSPMPLILSMIEACAARFESVIMITNGYALSKLPPESRLKALISLRKAGLTVLSISRHGVSEENNTEIMRLSTKAEDIAVTYREYMQSVKFTAADGNDTDNHTGVTAVRNTGNELDGLRLRWVCVLQKGAVDSVAKLGAYLDWVVSTGVQEICFKELYVSSTTESLYYEQDSNAYSRDHQVSLRLLTEFLENQGARTVGTLPWGCPIYELDWCHGGTSTTLKVVAYTEPTVFWERQNRICRSWNLMSDGDCYSSLETKESIMDV